MSSNGHDGAAAPRGMGGSPGASRGVGGSAGEARGWRRVSMAMAGVPRLLALVWRTDRLQTLNLAVVTIAQSAIPALSVLATQNIIDAVVNAVRSGGQASLSPFS